VRFVVLGAGAVGGVVGARLHEAGHDVVLVARGAHGAAIREHGLRFRTPAGETKLRIPAVERVAEADVRDDDVVLLAVKSQDTELALRDLAATGAGPAVVCVQNGLESERLALRRFERVYGVLVLVPGVHLEPGVVEVHAAPESGILDLGRYPRGVDEPARELAAALTGATFLSEPREDVMAWKAAKLLSNLTNAVEALAGRDGTDEVRRAAVEEGERVLAAAGIPFVPRPELMARSRELARTGTKVGSSTWQSLARGAGELEVDFLNGEIVLLARLHGVEAPVNERLQRLAREHAARGGAPGAVPVSELLP
jgi:2-dehydropantoate 2-reductase